MEEKKPSSSNQSKQNSPVKDKDTIQTETVPDPTNQLSQQGNADLDSLSTQSNPTAESIQTEGSVIATPGGQSSGTGGLGTTIESLLLSQTPVVSPGQSQVLMQASSNDQLPSNPPIYTIASDPSSQQYDADIDSLSIQSNTTAESLPIDTISVITGDDLFWALSGIPRNPLPAHSEEVEMTNLSGHLLSGTGRVVRLEDLPEGVEADYVPAREDLSCSRCDEKIYLFGLIVLLVGIVTAISVLIIVLARRVAEKGKDIDEGKN